MQTMTTHPAPTPTREQLRAGVALIFAVSECIREAQTIPAGLLYVALMDRLTIQSFNSVLDTLKRAELIEEGPDHLIRWIGPERAQEVN
jgi:hypothetical protein